MPIYSLGGRVRSKLGRESDRLGRWVLAHVNTGNTVKCVLCDWSGRNFLRGHICPQCNVMARTRLVPYALKRFGLDSTGKTLLHLGPNRSEVSWIDREMMPRVHLVADIVRKPIATLVCDATLMPIADESVDLAIAWHILEHIRDDRGVMHELRRVLKPGGRVLMSVPIFPPGRLMTFEDHSVPRERARELYGDEDHVRAPGFDYGDRFLADGFPMRRMLMSEMKTAEENADVIRFGLSRSHAVWCFERMERPVSES